LARATAIAIAAMAAGCSPKYEIDRPGTWQPTGANDFNLKAMVADKADLTSGAASTTDRGNVAARAVTRLYTDRRRALQDVSLSKIGPGTSGADTSGGGALPAAGASP
jgi:hypothetical protein